MGMSRDGLKSYLIISGSIEILIILDMMERRMMRKYHVRCGMGENLAIVSKSYLSLFNPIIQNRDGYVIWNQSTSYLRTSKYQDVNVVRLVLQIKRDLERELRNFIFDINDSMTWVLMNSAVNAYLGNLVASHALNTFATKIYATDYDISRHRVRVDIMLDPKQVIYQILLTISV